MRLIRGGEGLARDSYKAAPAVGFVHGVVVARV